MREILNRYRMKWLAAGLFGAAAIWALVDFSGQPDAQARALWGLVLHPKAEMDPDPPTLPDEMSVPSTSNTPSSPPPAPTKPATIEPATIEPAPIRPATISPVAG
jgi:hypothetical protein